MFPWFLRGWDVKHLSENGMFQRGVFQPGLVLSSKQSRRNTRGTAKRWGDWLGPGMDLDFRVHLNVCYGGMVVYDLVIYIYTHVLMLV